MKKILLLLMFCIVLGTAVIAKEKTPPVPNIEFNRDEWDFGNIKEGEGVSGTFNIRNSGNADLIIGNLRPSCKCTTATISSRTIEPGGMTEVKFNFNSEGYRDKINQIIWVESNDPDEKNKKFSIRGEIRPVLPEINMYIKTLGMDFPVSDEKETVEKFLIKNIGSDGIIIRGAKTSSPEYEISVTTGVMTPQNSIPAYLKLRPQNINTTDYIYLEIAIPFTTEIKK